MSVCSICGKSTYIFFNVDDMFWKKIVDEMNQNEVICLECFDKISRFHGEDVVEHLTMITVFGTKKVGKFTNPQIYSI